MTGRQIFLKLIYPLIMLRSRFSRREKAVRVNTDPIQPPVSFYDLVTTANDGTPFHLNRFAGKKILVVNTASDCGFTAQYAELEKLFQKYQQHLVVVGFPANDFKEQEKEDDKAIAAFCKINYGVTFPLMKKSVVVKGPEQNAVFAWLSHKDQNGWCDQQPVWNFSKYLVDEKGVLTHFFSPTVSPLSSEVVNAVNAG